MKIELSESLLRKSLVIFDFDGVIADSVEVKTDAFYSLYRIYGEDIALKVVEHHIANGGMSRFDKFDYYNRTFLSGLRNLKSVEDLSVEFSLLVKEKVIQSDFISGSIDFLDYLQTKKIICVIISATPESEIKEIVFEKGLSKYFSLVFGSPSNKVINIDKTLKKLNIQSKNCIFFGDAKNDMEASLNCNIDFVGVGSSILDTVNNFKTMHPHIYSFTELNNELKKD